MFKILDRLPQHNRVSLCFWVGALAVVAYMFTSGRPPAHAQDKHQIISTERVITQTDEQQDLAISKLQEFRANQENWNKQTGDEVSGLNASVWKFWGGLAAIGFMTTGAIGVTLRTKIA